MILQRLTVHNFKNIGEAHLDFSPKVNCFLGNNGMGKSNLLDAVYYLSFCKSFSGVQDSMLIKRDEEFLLVKGSYLRREVEEEVSIGFALGKRKSLKRKGKEYQRLSTHIGSFPLVMVAPQDIDLVRGSSDYRRRFMDMVISQSDARYLDALIRYNHSLEQRNKLLRDHVIDPDLYIAVESSMAQTASYIYASRSAWVRKLTAIFNRYYNAIAGESDAVSLQYCSSLNHPGVTMETLLAEARRHDEEVRYTSVGIHRDDLGMDLSGMPVRRTASQGQCKTYTIALRLAQYEFLHDTSSLRPLLLLDDIFDKLDASRVQHIMEVVSLPLFGQIFITDTNRTHLDKIMERIGGDYRMWEVTHGCFNLINAQENETNGA